MDYKTILNKSMRVFHEEGLGMLFRKGSIFLTDRLRGKRVYSDKESAMKCYMDVLFINGCYLDHPSRYRVSHQREQLAAANFSTAEIFYTDISIEMVKNFRAFIFFRCPYTEDVGKFITKAREYNKRVLFDIDDLVIDRKYTDMISYVQEMSYEDRMNYNNGVEAIKKTLMLCDGVITTTEVLAEELRKYTKEVYINRNVVSEEMLKLSEDAIIKRKVRNDIRLGYFSGSITHNADFKIILPALVRLMKEYKQLRLVLAGDLSVPEELKPWNDRVFTTPMVNWKKLPELIANVDINLAPLEDSIFNRAKSENKWLEALLVKIPTIASDVGAFASSISNEKNGILCDNNEEDWYNKLKRLIEDESYRKMLAENAYTDYRVKKTTIYTAARFGDYINKVVSPNIVWMLPVMQISGGALVTLKHASIMHAKRYDVTIFNFGYENISEVYHDGFAIPVISMRDMKIHATIDKCVSTLWTTCDFFEKYGRIKNKYYLVQNYETDFYQSGDLFRLKANSTYLLKMPVKYITISKWCQKWLKDEFLVDSNYAPNGLNTEKFYPEERDYDGKIRILIEGNSDDYYKNVDESFRIVNELEKDKYEIWFMSYQGKPKEWYRVDKFFHKVPYDEVPEIYRKCHILIKSSILESFSYPPLEMMATGGCVVVTPNDGNIEYLENEVNCLFYRRGEIQEAVEAIKKIVDDKELRERIIDGGKLTGQLRKWETVRNNVEDLYI